MSYRLVDKRWNLSRFRKYLSKVNLSWASSVTVHHTGAPSLRQRPKGLLSQHIRNLQDFYQRILGWSRGPHLFVDRDEILGMSPLTERGVHAVSFNRRSIGIEALGNYDEEDPTTERGLEVMKMTAGSVAIILKKMGKSPNRETVKFHRDDPKTSKTCPGARVDKDWFIGLVKEAMVSPIKSAPVAPDAELPSRESIIAESILWQTKQLRKTLTNKEDRQRLDAIDWQAKKIKS